MKLYFVSRNDAKISEVLDLIRMRESQSPHGLELHPVREDVQEILSPDLEEVVRSKALEAYKLLRQPCVVEHGGLFFTGAQEFPGVFGRIVWRALQDRMVAFLREGESREAEARACLGYCDGQRIRFYQGVTRGQVALAARGDYNRHSWDPIFIPEGCSETYGEMGSLRKRDTSPLLKAWDLFFADLGRVSRRGGRV
jgi:XTP/dITP diphosphohydrolase